jgi:hypothetical protein
MYRNVLLVLREDAFARRRHLAPLAELEYHPQLSELQNISLGENNRRNVNFAKGNAPLVQRGG